MSRDSQGGNTEPLRLTYRGDEKADADPRDYENVEDSGNDSVEEDEEEYEGFIDEPNEPAKKKISRIFIVAGLCVVLLAVAAAIFYVRHRREVDGERQANAALARQEALTRKWMTEFNADDTWQKRIDEIEAQRGALYTADIDKELLVRSIAFESRITEIETNGWGSYKIEFGPAASLRLFHSISFSLTCPTELVDTALERGGRNDTYLVVADVTRVDTVREREFVDEFGFGEVETIATGSCRGMIAASTLLSD